MDIDSTAKTQTEHVACSDAGYSRCRITALLTSFNRKAYTLECLARLELAARRAGVTLDAVLVDDASTDGTTDAVAAAFTWVTVERGDGSLFWNRGMHRAQAIAMRREVDFLLWINDDTLLTDDALVNLMRTNEALRERLGQPVIVVGATADSATGMLTYGGSVAVSRWRRFTYRRVWSATEPVKCEAMNGNLVLLPMEIVRVVGNFDPVFEHAMGDTDYALRTRLLGFEIWVAPGFAGSCGHNSVIGTYLDKSLPFARRLKHLMSRKGLPWRSWLVLTRRHAGSFWPLYFCMPYARFILKFLIQRISVR